MEPDGYVDDSDTELLDALFPSFPAALEEESEIYPSIF
jgi:hypothetical protein